VFGTFILQILQLKSAFIIRPFTDGFFHVAKAHRTITLNEKMTNNTERITQLSIYSFSEISIQIATPAEDR
jgi:hypothetical protein